MVDTREENAPTYASYWLPSAGRDVFIPDLVKHCEHCGSHIKPEAVKTTHRETELDSESSSCSNLDADWAPHREIVNQHAAWYGSHAGSYTTHTPYTSDAGSEKSSTCATPLTPCRPAASHSHTTILEQAPILNNWSPVTPGLPKTQPSLKFCAPFHGQTGSPELSVQIERVFREAIKRRQNDASSKHLYGDTSTSAQARASLHHAMQGLFGTDTELSDPNSLESPAVLEKAALDVLAYLEQKRKISSLRAELDKETHILQEFARICAPEHMHQCAEQDGASRPAKPRRTLFEMSCLHRSLQWVLLAVIAVALAMYAEPVARMLVGKQLLAVRAFRSRVQQERATFELLSCQPQVAEQEFLEIKQSVAWHRLSSQAVALVWEHCSVPLGMYALAIRCYEYSQRAL